jgi:hypothetical protein
MTLEAHRLYEIMDYMNETRKPLFALTGKTPDTLFVRLSNGERFHNMLSKLVKHLLKQNLKIRDIKQLRVLAITN